MKYMRLAYTNKFRVFLSQQSLFDHGYPLYQVYLSICLNSKTVIRVLGQHNFSIKKYSDMLLLLINFRITKTYKNYVSLPVNILIQSRTRLFCRQLNVIFAPKSFLLSHFPLSLCCIFSLQEPLIRYCTAKVLPSFNVQYHVPKQWQFSSLQ